MILHFFRFSAWALVALSFFGVAISPAETLENIIPKGQEPILQVFRPDAAEQSKPGTGKFVIFTREKVGVNWDFIAGAWECIPSHPEIPIKKRMEFCHSSWNGDQLLDSSALDESQGRQPRFIRLQVDSGDDYAVNLYDINYRTWEARCLWQGNRLTAFGLLGDFIFCKSSDGWLLLDATTGVLSKNVPFIPIQRDENFWLVRKAGENDGCWSYDRVKRQFIGHFAEVDIPRVGLSRSKLSSDGRNRAWVLVPLEEAWRRGTIAGKLLLQRNGTNEEISVPIEMQAQRGSGVPVIPRGISLGFRPDGHVEFRAQSEKDEAEDHVWRIDIASGKVTKEIEPHRSPSPAGDEDALLDGVPVPDYLRTHVGGLEQFGRSGLAPAFLMHLGILSERSEYADCTTGVSPDGRHILYAARKGPLAGFYIYGDLATKTTVRWKSPKGLDCRDAQDFVWVETPD